MKEFQGFIDRIRGIILRVYGIKLLMFEKALVYGICSASIEVGRMVFKVMGAFCWAIEIFVAVFKSMSLTAYNAPGLMILIVMCMPVFLTIFLILRQTTSVILRFIY